VRGPGGRSDEATITCRCERRGRELVPEMGVGGGVGEVHGLGRGEVGVETWASWGVLVEGVEWVDREVEWESWMEVLRHEEDSGEDGRCEVVGRVWMGCEIWLVTYEQGDGV
jgi:hypothetical protein